jgi:hypothetical protein
MKTIIAVIICTLFIAGLPASAQEPETISCEEYLEVFAFELVEIENIAEVALYDLDTIEAQQSRSLLYLRLMIARERMRQLDDKLPGCATVLHQDFLNLIELTADTTGLWSLQEPLSPELALQIGIDDTAAFQPLMATFSETSAAMYNQVYEEFLAIREKLENEPAK